MPVPTPPASPPAPPAAPSALPAPVASVDTGAPAGWTVDHIKAAAAAYTAKHSPADLQAILTRYVPPASKPTIGKVPGASWPALYAELSAG
jgi:hypothetical protein